MNAKSYINPRNAFLLSMLLIGVGLATSNILMSWGEIGLAIAFIWDGKYRAKVQQVLKNKRMLAIMAVYGLFVLGLLHTSNYIYALHDLKIKLPLVVIPFLVVSFFPLSQKEFKIIFHSIFVGVMVSVVFGTIIYLGLIKWEINDMRSYSPFVSNVRLGTLLVFSIFLAGYFIKHKTYLYTTPLVYLLFIALCIAFLLLIQSLTGIVALVMTIFMLAIYGLGKKQSRKTSLFFLIVFVLVVGTLSILTIGEYHRIHNIEKVNVNQLPKSTIHGAVYRHNIQSTETVNGHYVRLNVCNWELKREWNKRSTIDYEGVNNKGWPVNETLIKYLTSKGVKKNAEAVIALTDKEIKGIENGMVNYLSLNPLDIRWRINQLLEELYEYNKDGDPNGRSFATRLETWKTAWSAVQGSLLFGYGTGDVKDEMNRKYIALNSKLNTKNYLNPHQQYLAVAIAIGIFGLVLFIGLLFYPIVKFSHLHALFLIAITIVGIGMLDEDTLETQAGCTQFVFIYVVTYLLHKSKNAMT